MNFELNAQETQVDDPKKESISQALEVQRVEVKPYPALSLELLEKYASMPYVPNDDPEHPEWPPSPQHRVDLTSYGYGEVIVHDESGNPTGTHKDRASWEAAAAMRDWAISMLLKQESGKLSQEQIENTPIPRVSVLSMGNAAVSLSERFKVQGLPPVKLLVSSDTPPEKMREMRGLWADVYTTQFGSKPLSGNDIRFLTENPNGFDVTSDASLEEAAILYDWLAHEVLNARPSEIYLPYGTGRLMENLAYWQHHNARQLVHNQADPRLNQAVDLHELTKISLLAAEPLQPDSIADKLPAPFKPFKILNTEDYDTLRRMGFTGTNTGVYGVEERYIEEAHGILTEQGVANEPSGAAALALYLQRFKQGKVDQAAGTPLVINTGKGRFAPEVLPANAEQA